MNMKPLGLQVFASRGISFSLILIATLALSPSIVQAETVQIPIGQQGQNKNVQRPKTGQSQETVKQQFGNPIDWTNPVGEPPITKWTYADFVVYFEYDHVIHSVLKHTPQPDDGAISGSVVNTDNTTSSGSTATDVLRGSE